MNNLLEPLKISNINLNNLSYGKTKVTRDKKLVLLKYNNCNFVFQSPRLNLVSRFDNNIEVSLSGKDNSKVNEFINFLGSLENKIKTDSQKYYNQWFDIANDTINFQKIVRESQQYNKGVLKLKLIDTQDFKTEVKYNSNKNNQNVWVKLIIEVYGIWINSDNNFGVYMRPISVLYEDKKTYNYKFVESDSEDEVVDIPDTEVQCYKDNNLFIQSPHVEDINTLLTNLESLSSISSLGSSNSNKSIEEYNNVSCTLQPLSNNNNDDDNNDNDDNTSDIVTMPNTVNLNNLSNKIVTPTSSPNTSDDDDTTSSSSDL